MKEVKYPMPKCNVIKPPKPKKVRVIENFTLNEDEYFIGDILEISKSQVGNYDLVFDGKNAICEVDTVFFNNRFEYVDKKIELSSNSKQLNTIENEIDYNNTKLAKLLKSALTKEIMKLSLKWNIKQVEQIINRFTDKLELTNEVIIHRGIEYCANEILETLYFYSSKEIQKEFGIIKEDK